MSDRPVKVPDARHPITVRPNPARVIVKANGRVVADTLSAFTLREATYPPVHYVPRKDVDMSQLQRSELTTYCPPFDPVAPIREHLAFYPDRVDSIAEEKQEDA